MAEILRTPEERFADLSDFPYNPIYIQDLQGYEGLRMHFVDVGSQDAEHTFLCLHGQPTWSYLYRKMIPIFANAGNRVIAPDFFGFGRSDKPINDDVYTFDFHRQSLISFIAQLDLQNITLVCQDWGGILGLTLPMEMPQRFSRLLIMNTALATGDVKPSKGFLAWQAWVSEHPDLSPGRLLKQSCPHLSDKERAAYDAPFPDVTYKAGVRRFPAIVPTQENAPGAALSRKAREWLRTEWSGQTFMAIGMQDPVLGPPAMYALRKIIRNCPEPIELAEAGHFVQEWGAEIATKALSFFK